MGMFSWLKGKGRAPDPSKREAGFSVVSIYPYLFTKPEDMFAEVKKDILPYLSEEEEEAILNHFEYDSRSFRAFIPKDTYKMLTKVLANSEVSPFKTFGVHLSSRDIENLCCSSWFITGNCCRGIAMPDHVVDAIRNRRLEGKDDPRLKDYFIIDHIERRMAEYEQMLAQSVSDESVATSRDETLPRWLESNL